MELSQSAGAAKTRTRTQGLDRQFFALPTVVAESVEELHRLVSGGSRMLMFCEDRYLFTQVSTMREVASARVKRFLPKEEACSLFQ